MNKTTFISNRKKIIELMKDNSVMILFNKPILEPNKRGRIDRNFYYATGNTENDNILLLSKIDDVSDEMIFIKPYNELVAKWDGAFLSKEDVINQTGIEQVLYVEEFNEYIEKLQGQISDVYININDNIKNALSYNQRFANELENKHPHLNIINVNEIFKKIRMIKSEDEILKMRAAIAITKDGIENMIKNARAGMYEYQIESFFDQVIKYNNASHAFTTIAAGANNACCLHYSANNTILNDGDLMLLDLGASFENYNADISRTFPINGKFSERQKELYNIVLNGQIEAMKFIKPGVTLTDINNHLLDYYEIKLKEIGLIEERSEISKYYFHRISHHLGLDTHDLSDFNEPLVEGMVITCEPGLYINDENIGIRIEDDILITKDGNINLSQDILKTIDEIENFMKNR